MKILIAAILAIVIYLMPSIVGIAAFGVIAFLVSTIGLAMFTDLIVTGLSKRTERLK